MRPYGKEKTVSSINSVAKTGYPHAKEWIWPLPYTIHKKLTIDSRSKLRSTTIKL